MEDFTFRAGTFQAESIANKRFISDMKNRKKRCRRKTAGI